MGTKFVKEIERDKYREPYTVPLAAAAAIRRDIGDANVRVWWVRSGLQGLLVVQFAVEHGHLPLRFYDWAGKFLREGSLHGSEDVIAEMILVPVQP